MTRIRFTAYIGCLLLLAGCSTSQVFQPILDKPLDKATIYIYRPEVKGERTEFSIRANGVVVGYLKNGAYLYHFADPGDVELNARVLFNLFTTGMAQAIASGSTNLKLSVEPGKDYYVRASAIQYTSWVGLDPQKLDLTSVGESSGLYEIQKCRLIPWYRSN